MAVSNINRYNRGPKKGQWKPKSEWVDSPWRVHRPEPRNKSGYANRFFPTKKEAEAFDAKKKEERRTGASVDEKAGQQFISAYAYAWLASMALKPRSEARYRSVIRLHIIPFFGKMRVVEVQRTDVNRWIKQKVEEKYAPATIHGMYDVLAGMFKAAVLDQIRGATPCVKINNLPTRPKRSNKRQKWLPTRLQVTALARAFAPRFRLAILVAAGCGLRFGEVMGLTVEDFDFQCGLVRVRRQLTEECTCDAVNCMETPKSAKSVREVGMPASVATAARAHIAAGYVRTLTMTDHTVDVKPGAPAAVRELRMMFTTATGKPLGRSAWSGLWHAAIKKAGQILAKAPTGRTGFTLHTLRHYFGSQLIAAGWSPVEVQGAMGHANPTITINEYVWPVRTAGGGNAPAPVDAVFDDAPDMAA